MKLFFCALFLFLFSACAGKPPFTAYSIAQTALKSARKASADKNAGIYWSKAIKYYREGKQSWDDMDYTASAKFFNESIKWSEKAENISRFKMSTGEGV